MIIRSIECVHCHTINKIKHHAMEKVKVPPMPKLFRFLAAKNVLFVLIALVKKLQPYPDNFSSILKEKKLGLGALEQRINKEDSSQSLSYVCCPKVEIYVKMLCVKLQSLVVGGSRWSSNMVAGKQCKHLEPTLAIMLTDFPNRAKKQLYVKHFSYT